MFIGESWKKTLAKHHPGEAGKVYFINLEAIFSDNVRWTRAVPFTLNPEHGKTLESVLLGSKEIPGPMKRKLIDKRVAELPGNKCLIKIYISEDQAPDTWGVERHENEKGSGLILL
jgi:hypothetical protein